jgi:hypothetical protein
MTTTTFVTVPAGPGAEDKPGTFGRVARCLADNKLNIEAYAIDAGGIRLLTNDSARTSTCLLGKGFRPQTVECFEIRVPDRPGELGRIGEELGKANINIVSSFGVAAGGSGRIFLRVDAPEKAAPILERYSPTVRAA